MKPEDIVVFRLALAMAGGLKFRERVGLEQKISDGQLLNLNKFEVERLIYRELRSCWEPLKWLQMAESQWNKSRCMDIWIMFWDDSAYPEVLRTIPDPPYVLWGRGVKPSLDHSWCAVVGTRYPTEEAKKASFELSYDLASAGATVVSGLALGIDAQAHRGCIEASGCTVAVLGQGIDWVSPQCNRGLARRILNQGGTIFSEYGPGIEAKPYHFPARNRLVSGLCRTVAVIQAPISSGALITADFALDQGRDVVVHQAGILGERGAGTRGLALQGAPVIKNAGDILELWTSGKTGLNNPEGWLNWKG